MAEAGRGVCSKCAKIEPLSYLNDAPVFSVGNSRYPSALRNSLVIYLECTSFVDLHYCFLL